MSSLRKPESALTWQKMGDWRFVTPPSRPGADNLSFVQSHLRSLARDAKVAVLGATVEYRELLAQMGFSDITVFEKNLDFFHSISKFARSSSSEKVVAGDWLETLPRFSHHFSAILSHLTSGNVAYSARTDFYSAIATALDERGIFLDYILKNDRPWVSVGELERGFKSAPVNIDTANNFSCLAVFCSEYVQRHGVVETNAIYDLLYQNLSRECHPIVDLCQYVTPRGGYWYYGKPWIEVEKYFRDLFCLQEIEQVAPSAYAGRASHFAMKTTSGVKLNG